MDISEFSSLDNQSNYQRHPWEISRKNVLHKLLLKGDLNFPIDRIIDIGSGDVYVIHTLVEKNMAKEYFALDMAYTPEVIEQLKNNNNNNSVVHYFQNLEKYLAVNPNQEATLFLCMDVLEHLEHEKIILDYLTQESNENYYFFAVPAFQSVFSSHDVLLGHYRRYKLHQLENLLIKNNFEIKDKGYYFISLLIFRKIENF